MLVAEDSPVNQILLTDFLELRGHEVIVADDGAEAVRLALQQRPDVILMDVQMPQMDGLEATRRIRATADGAHVPIIAVTALAMDGDRDRCLAAGCDDHVSKPIDLPALADLAERLAGLPRSGGLSDPK